MVITGFCAVGMYRVYRKDKSQYSMGLTLFFVLFVFSRICLMVLVYIYGYDGVEQYLLPTPTLLWLQLGYNILSYGGVFILYLVLEHNIIKTKYIFSVVTLILLTISIVNYFMLENIFLYQIPFFIPVVLGFPGIYLYLAAKNTGELRTNSLKMAVGMIIFELGIILGIPNAQASLWSVIMPPIVYEILSPILFIIGTIIVYSGFRRHTA